MRKKVKRNRIPQMLKEWSGETISELRSLVAHKLSVKIEYISEDQNPECLAEKYGQVMGGFRQFLRAEFIKSDTEGLLIDNRSPVKVDGTILSSSTPADRERCAYFTAWHELAHLLLYPRRQAVFETVEVSSSPAQNHLDTATYETSSFGSVRLFEGL